MWHDWVHMEASFVKPGLPKCCIRMRHLQHGCSMPEIFVLSLRISLAKGTTEKSLFHHTCLWHHPTMQRAEYTGHQFVLKIQWKSLKVCFNSGLHPLMGLANTSMKFTLSDLCRATVKKLLKEFLTNDCEMNLPPPTPKKVTCALPCSFTELHTTTQEIKQPDLSETPTEIWSPL